METPEDYVCAGESQYYYPAIEKLSFITVPGIKKERLPHTGSLFTIATGPYQ
jgi:hypothetical protein